MQKRNKLVNLVPRADYDVESMISKGSSHSVAAKVAFKIKEVYEEALPSRFPTHVYEQVAQILVKQDVTSYKVLGMLEEGDFSRPKIAQ